MDAIQNYIDGELVDAVSGGTLDNVDPSTGRVYGTLPDSDAADVERAVEAAERAFPAWSGLTAGDRAAFLRALASRIETDLEVFARAESIDNGKPLKLARMVDIPRSVTNLRFFAGAIEQFASEFHATDQETINYTLRGARGVAGVISPWNLPLYLFTWKIAPALAAGNTLVAKPSEMTPMTAYMLSRAAIDIGLPPGVLNIVHGLGARVGPAMTEHERIPTISFTGGTATGKDIASRAAPRFKKLSLELGGKNPNIIFADADMDRVLAESVRSGFANQGEICLCGSRIFVEDSVYEDFVAAYVERVRGLVVGDPLEEKTDLGALVSAAHRDKVASYVDLARQEGGTILCGGKPPGRVSDRCADGFFFEPTVIVDLDVRCRTNMEEIFGPVVTITPFRDEAEVVEYANATEYGLAASIWTENLSRAHRVAHAVDSGVIWVNCWLVRDLRVPFGGMKKSGVGREGGEEALRFFTEAKNVCIHVPRTGPRA